MRSAQPVKGRAETNDEKCRVVLRLLAAWQKEPKLRLGQLIHNATNGRDIFYDEDFPLVEQLEDYTGDKGVSS